MVVLAWMCLRLRSRLRAYVPNKKAYATTSTTNFAPGKTLHLQPSTAVAEGRVRARPPHSALYHFTSGPSRPLTVHTVSAPHSVTVSSHISFEAVCRVVGLRPTHTLRWLTSQEPSEPRRRRRARVGRG